MSRRTVRSQIATFFGGTVWDEDHQIYRPTLLGASGLAGVREYYPTRFPDEDRFATLEAGRGMGAVMAVHLPDVIERRVAWSGPTAGVKANKHKVQLYLFHLALAPRVQDAQADLDDLIDAVITMIHGDRTLGGAVIEVGETEHGITTSATIPAVEPATRVEQAAVISFDALTYPTA